MPRLSNRFLPIQNREMFSGLASLDGEPTYRKGNVGHNLERYANGASPFAKKEDV
jgi:hypothetical protein